MVEDQAEVIRRGRTAVFKAFRAWYIPAASPTSYFSGQKRPARQALPRGLPPALKEERKLRRLMGYDEVHATASRTAGKSRPNVHPAQTMDGAVHRAISGLDPIEFLWVQYCYRPPGVARTTHGENFFREYFKRYQTSHLKHCGTGTRRMVRYLISVAMENEANPFREVKPKGADIDRRNWNKTYRPHWFRICLEISNIDSSALYKVGREITQ